MDSALSHVTIIDPSAESLAGQQRNDTSQFGEDGLIEAVFDRIGESSRWCFEVGASDGALYSNTKRLRDLGWNAILIEGDGRLCEECRRFENDRVKVIHERIDSGSLDAILARCGSPRPDLGVIDIDGQDYWAWKGLEAKPRVMLVEFGYWNPPATIPPLGSQDAALQADLETICELGREKGYLPLAKTYCNVLFVDKEAWESN